jgi:haloalkane dehalogenase
VSGVPGSRSVEVLGTSMSVVDAGSGTPVLFLHGNPTSSFLWRHVVAAAPAGFRCVAVDLVGMGASGKPDIGYRLADHIAHVDALVDALGLGETVIVAHDWGVAIAFERMRRLPDQVRAVAFMEAHLRPLPGWEAFDEGGRELFRQLRTPGVGERMVLAENFFVDTLLPAAMQRELTAAEWAAYRAPYPDEASRRPLLQWAREIPVAGEPADVADRMAAGAAAVAASPVPKLLLHGSPGAIVTPETVAWCRDALPNLTITDIGGPAAHFLPEDRPHQVATAIWNWATAL